MLPDIQIGDLTMEGKEPAKDLRTIAALFEEHIHLVALKDSGINSVADLKGKRVSLDEPGSGTYVDANLILESNGLSAADLTAEALKGGAASEALRNGKIDAYFVVAGYPTGSLVELASAAEIKLVPIDGDGAKALADKYGFFSQSDIPAGTYEDVKADTPTFGLANGLVISADVPEERVYQMTKAVFENLEALGGVHPAFKKMSAKTVLNGFGSPLHPGALRYYSEIKVPGIEEFVTRTGG